MKIGIDCRIYSPKFTGIGRYTKELVDHFIKLNQQQGFPHELVLFFNSAEYKIFEPSRNVKKVLVNARHYSFSEQLKFLRILNREKLDLTYFPHFNMPILYRRPFIVTIHDLILSFFPGRKMTGPIHRLAYHLIIRTAVHRAKKVLTISESTKNDIITHLKAKAKKIQVIPNGVDPKFTLLRDPSQAQPTLKKYNITKQFLLYTGVWRNHKNLPRMIEAFYILRTKHHLDLQLVITGKPDPKYPEVQQTIKRLQLEDHVITPGLVSDDELIYLYNAALLFIFPSLYEGFGLPPLESMSCGTPVVASHTSSIPEICGDNAIYFDPYNVEDIAAKIYSLYTDADLQAELVQKGIKHAAQFTWEKTATQTWQALTRS